MATSQHLLRTHHRKLRIDCINIAQPALLSPLEADLALLPIRQSASNRSPFIFHVLATERQSSSLTRRSSTPPPVQHDFLSFNLFRSQPGSGWIRLGNYHKRIWKTGAAYTAPGLATNVESAKGCPLLSLIQAFYSSKSVKGSKSNVWGRLTLLSLGERLA